MNYTENYHLPQWEETDRIMRTDFNQMCADIDQGIATAQETADLPSYVVGSYVSDGYFRTIELGFRPSLMIIFGAKTADAKEDRSIYMAVVTENFLNNHVRFLDTGFTLQNILNNNIYPKLNERERTYVYIAFR